VRKRVLDLELSLVTSEPAPLALFGRRASEAVRAALEEAGVEVHVSTYAVEATGEGLVTVRGGTLPASRVVSLPRLSAPEVGGVPRDRAGFVPVDAHGRVLGLEDVYAAGDLTTFPVKQGGLATQQADAVAEAVAAAAGAPIEPTPFRPVLRALLPPRSRSGGRPGRSSGGTWRPSSPSSGSWRRRPAPSRTCSRSRSRRRAPTS
jgi:sulfide:quinone oxidoreductase